MSTDPIKEALHLMPYGFYAVTSRADGDYNAMVANWIMQVSFTPRLLAFGLAKKAHSHQLIAQGGVFNINIFRQADEDAIKGYTKARAKNPDKLQGVAYALSPVTGCPILPDVAAYLECKVTQWVETGGDHDIVVAEMVGAEVLKPGEAADSLTLPGLGWSYAG